MFGTGHCLECYQLIEYKIRRDLDRKKFCSQTCRSTFNGRLRDMSFMQFLANIPESNKKKSLQGSKHPRYISDRSTLKTRQRHENYEWIKLCLSRDNYNCVECGVGGSLQVHHKAPYNRFPELRWELNNGISLCKDCHKMIHNTCKELFGKAF